MDIVNKFIRKYRSDIWNPDRIIIETIVCKYLNGVSAKQLGLEYGVADITVTSLLKRSNIKIRNRSDAHRTNLIDENIFDIITDESAYWIGFVLSDGNVFFPKNKSKTLNFGLAKRDYNHLNKFKKFIKSNKNLYYYKNNAYLSVYSNKIVNKLIEFGIVPRKSKIVKTPILLKDNKHFWRGMIDGDGWLGFNKYGYPHIGLCGTINIVDNFITFIGHGNLNVKADNFGEVRYDCTTAQTVARYIYKDEKLYLQRKYDIYQQIDRWKPKYIQKSRSLLCIK